MKASPAPKGALASLLRGKKPKEEEENEVAQSSPEELKKQQQAVQEALLNSLPGDEQLKHEHQTSPEPLRWRQLRRRRFLHPVSFGTPLSKVREAWFAKMEFEATMSFLSSQVPSLRAAGVCGF